MCDVILFVRNFTMGKSIAKDDCAELSILMSRILPPIW